jgi:hypothetical protein
VDERTELNQLIDTWFEQRFASWQMSHGGQYSTVLSAVQDLKQRLKGRSIEQPAADGQYRSPYMLLMERAVRELGITAERQLKSEAEVQPWFRAQTCDGWKISENLVKAMATLVRRPESAKGGNKKMRVTSRHQVTDRKG